MKKKKHGIIIGRMCPMHLGHRRLIQTMLNEFGDKNSLMLLGSCNAPQSMKHFFNYIQRRSFIKKVFPNLRIMGLPDFHPDNDLWLQQLDDTLTNCGFDPERVKFFAGTAEDIEVLIKDSREYTSVDRYDRTVPIVQGLSGEMVRAALSDRLPRKDIAELVGDDIADDVIAAFQANWMTFLKK